MNSKCGDVAIKSIKGIIKAITLFYGFYAIARCRCTGADSFQIESNKQVKGILEIEWLWYLLLIVFYAPLYAQILFHIWTQFNANRCYVRFSITNQYSPNTFINWFQQQRKKNITVLHAKKKFMCIHQALFDTYILIHITIPCSNRTFTWLTL